MARNHEPVTIEKIRATHKARREEIRARLLEFDHLWQTASDDQLWEELVFCIFTAGASARMGLSAIEAVRPLLANGRSQQMTRALIKARAHRYPAARPGYIVVTRRYLQRNVGMQLRHQLLSFSDPVARRDWLAQEPEIKGLSYKESSHFLRNIGFKGYGILDKHVLRCLSEIGVIESSKPPGTRRQYLAIESTMRDFAGNAGIDFDELDLVLWSMKTGEILK
ncbi:MAG: N-glycosylase/DNA lyase [Blastocatellia bacterium]|nr:N-glycosylase/DNA lyase [Blastocatellia bacterium]